MRFWKRKPEPRMLPPIKTIDFIQQAESLLEFGYTHAAGCMLRISVEHWVKTIAENRDKSLAKSVHLLLIEDAIDLPTKKMVDRIIQCGNRAAHGDELSPDSVKDRIKQFRRVANLKK